MIYFTVEQVRFCHELILKETLQTILEVKGEITEEDRLQNIPDEFEGKIESIMNTFFYPMDNQYMPVSRVGRMVYDICTLHPFYEGNKRTAYFVAVVLLSINGLKYNAPADDIEKFYISVAKGEKTVKDTRKWIRKNTKIVFIRAMPLYLFQAFSIVLLKEKDIEFDKLGDSESNKDYFKVLIRSFVIFSVRREERKQSN